MLYIEWVLSYVKLPDDDDNIPTNLKIHNNVDPSKVEWGAEIHVPDDNLDKITQEQSYDLYSNYIDCSWSWHYSYQFM